MAAVSPTSASSRSGTPAPRSESASVSEPAPIAHHVVNRTRRRLGAVHASLRCGPTVRARGGGVHTEHPGDIGGGDGPLTQHPRLRTGHVDDGRGRALR